MTPPQPRLSQVSLWERHVELVLAILREALAIYNSARPEGGEPEHNRALSQSFLMAIRQRHDDGLITLDTPIFGEARNQPTPATAGQPAERKIPDFQCGFIDHYCPDPRSSVRMFVIECKCLGQPSSSGWNYNDHYVDDGIRRFVDEEHRYGNGVANGAMVGYLDHTTVTTVLDEVNGRAQQQDLAPLAHADAPPTAGQQLVELRHYLDRTFADSPFKLTHHWIQR